MFLGVHISVLDVCYLLKYGILSNKISYMLKGRTMEQYNKTTKQHISTTNWYLYKSYLHPLTAKPQGNKIEKTTSNRTQKRKINISKTTTNNTDNFEEILLEAIDEGLSIIGESAKKVVYTYLEKTFKMNRQEIPHRIDDYITSIEDIFGTGAKIIQIQTMKKLYKKVGYQIKQRPEQKNFTFRDYISIVKLEKEQRENN